MLVTGFKSGSLGYGTQMVNETASTIAKHRLQHPNLVCIMHLHAPIFKPWGILYVWVL